MTEAEKKDRLLKAMTRYQSELGSDKKRSEYMRDVEQMRAKTGQGYSGPMTEKLFSPWATPSPSMSSPASSPMAEPSMSPRATSPFRETSVLPEEVSETEEAEPKKKSMKNGDWAPRKNTIDGDTTPCFGPKYPPSEKKLDVNKAGRVLKQVQNFLKRDIGNEAISRINEDIKNGLSEDDAVSNALDYQKNEMPSEGPYTGAGTRLAQSLSNPLDSRADINPTMSPVSPLPGLLAPSALTRSASGMSGAIPGLNPNVAPTMWDRPGAYTVPRTPENSPGRFPEFAGGPKMQIPGEKIIQKISNPPFSPSVQAPQRELFSTPEALYGNQLPENIRLLLGGLLGQ